MPIITIMALEYFSCLLDSSHLIIILIMNMVNIMNTKFRYQVSFANGFRKISSLILFDGVDSSMKQGLRERD